MKIIVVGMHRSGTSMVGGILSSLGFYAGDDSDLLPAAPDNPKGFWERGDLKNLHDQLLDLRGYKWWKVSGLSQREFATGWSQEIEQEAHRILLQLDEAQHWFIKDPRLCLVNDFWKSRIENPIYVFVFREPTHVALSLNKRNGFSIQYGISLWQKYTVEALSSMDPSRTIVVDYSKFIQDPDQEIDALVKKLNALSSETVHLDDVLVANKVISPTLNHSSEASDLNDLMNADQQDLAKLLRGDSLQEAGQLLDVFNSSALDASLESEQQAYSQQRAYRRIKVLAQEKDVALAQLNEEIGQLEADVERSRSQIAKLVEVEKDLGNQLSSVKDENSKLELDIEEQISQITSLSEKNKALDEIRIALEKNQRSLQSKILIAEENAISLQSKFEIEQGRLAQSISTKRERLLKAVQDLEENHHLFGESWRWKIGNGTVSALEKILRRKNVELTIDKIPRQLEQLKSQLRELPNPTKDFDPDERVTLDYIGDETGVTRSFSTDQSGLFIEKEAPFKAAFSLSSQFPSPKRITIITPSTNIHGGTKRIITLARLLHERGHQVSFIRQYKSRSLDWFDFPIPVLDIWFREDTPLEELRRKIPDADVLITYGNNKANALLAQLPIRKGLKFSLFMHFGVHDLDLDIKNANLHEFKLLATTSWIANQLADKGYTRRVGTIGFGIYPGQFYPTVAKRDFKIGTLWHTSAWKNSEKVVAAYKALRKKKSFQNLKLILFGQDPNFKIDDPLITYIQDPSQQELREIYSSCSAWVVASEFEGIGMCGVEAMLCKTPLITTDTGGSKDFCNKDNSFIIGNPSAEEIGQAIEHVFANPNIADQKARKAYHDIAQHTWTRSIDRLESELAKDLRRINPIILDANPIVLSIGIPIHNQHHYVQQCIESIASCTSVSYEIILVDDGSDLDNQLAIEELTKDHNATLIRHEKQVGLPYNYNRILLKARGTFICILDSDTIVTKGWASSMIAELRKDPMLAMVGPSTSYGDAKNGDQIAQVLPRYVEGRKTLGPAGVARIGREVANTYQNTFEKTEYINGFCMMIQAKVIGEIGFFDTSFGLGTREDAQFIDRLRSAGYAVGWKKGVYVHHFGHTSFRGMEGFRELLAKNKELYYESKGLQRSLLKTNQKVLFIFTNQSSANRKRTFEPLKELSRFIEVKALHIEALDDSIIRSSDVIVLQRVGALNHLIEQAKLKKILGWIHTYDSKTFIYDIDDYLPHSQDGVPKQLMQAVDLITTTCDHLAGLLSVYNKRVLVIPNAFDWHRFRKASAAQTDLLSDAASKRIISFSLGGAGVDEMHRLAQLLKPMDFEVIFISSSISNVDDYPALTIMANMDLDDLFRLLPTCDYVINWGAHSDDYFDVLKERYDLHEGDKLDFINSKSGLKYYCAAAANAIFLSSATPIVYSELIRNGKNGYLIEDPDTCYYVIKQLEQDEKLQQEIRQAAHRDLISNYCLDSMALDWLKLLKALEEDGVGSIAEYSTPQKHHEKALSLSNLLDLDDIQDAHELTFGIEAEVDVIIPVHNALADTIRCINSVVKGTITPYRLIIVDDLSNDETRNYLSSHKGSHYTYVRNEINSGFTRSVNVGFAHASASIQVVLNSDTVVPVGWLKKIVQAFAEDESVGIVGCVSNAASFQSVPYVSDPATGDWYMEPPPIELSLWSSLVAYLADPVECPQVPIVNGFCLAVRKKVVDQVGRFDEENFPHGYGEENDFCVRVGDAGFKLVIREDCFVYHAKSKSFSHERRKKLSAEGSKALKAKHGREAISKRVEVLKNANPIDPLRIKMQALLGADSEPRIAYVLPSKTLGGGVISVLQVCETLGVLGKDANIIIPYQLQPKVEENFDIAETKIFTYRNKQDIARIASQFNVLVATHNSSVKYVQRAIELADHEIRPCYFIQDYEPRFYDEGSDLWQEAFESYEAIPQMTSYAKTKFLCQAVKQHHPGVEIRKIRPGFNLGLYRPSLQNIYRRKDDKIFVLTAMLRPSTARRAPQMVADVCKLFLSDRDTDQEIQVHFFGCTPDEIEEFAIDIDFPYTNHGILTPTDVFELLVASDVFLDMSTYQGFGRTGLEAMAAGCVPILPVDCGPEEYATDGSDAFLVDTSMVDAALEKLALLVADETVLFRMKQKGLETASGYDLVSDSLDQYTIFMEKSEL